MRQPSQQIAAEADRNRGIWILMPAVLSIALAAILFPLTQPGARVNQPFKAEVVLALVLILFLGVYYRRDPGADNHAAVRTSRVLAIIFTLAAFVIWSALSAFWAHSIDSVAHHTLLWGIYLTYFLVFSQNIRRQGIRLIMATFIAVALITGFLCVFDYVTLTDFVANEGALKIRYGKYAELLTTVSPVLWAALVYAKRQRLWLLLPAAILSWTTAMLALSKGAFLAGIIAFILFFAGAALFSQKGFRRRIITLAAGWIILTVGMQIVFSTFSTVPSTTDYITGKADPTRSTSAMRVFTWRVAKQMVADHWLTGVGADNFGLMFNRSRAAFRISHPDDPRVDIAEEYLVERAHNEPLQVLAELGAVGFILLLLPFVIFGLMLLRAARSRKLTMSPMLWGSVAGMAAFAVSSQFSSFSFRSAQNGVVFFMVFAIAVNEAAKSLRAKAGPRTLYARTARLAGFAAALLMCLYGSTKIYAEYWELEAERSATFAGADDGFGRAIAADPEYAAAYLTHSLRNAVDGDTARSAGLMRTAIDRGIGITPAYSQLAKMQVADGDAASAEATYREGLSIFPNSVYFRTEYILFLESQDRLGEAALQSDAARKVDMRQARGWYALMKTGSVKAFFDARDDPNIAPPADLLPFDAVRQYLDRVPGLSTPSGSDGDGSNK